MTNIIPKFAAEYTPTVTDNETKSAWKVYDYDGRRTWKLDYPEGAPIRVTDIDSGEELDISTGLYKDVCESVFAKCQTPSLVDKYWYDLDSEPYL